MNHQYNYSYINNKDHLVQCTNTECLKNREKIDRYEHALRIMVNNDELFEQIIHAVDNEEYTKTTKGIIQNNVSSNLGEDFLIIDHEDMNIDEMGLKDIAMIDKQNRYHATQKTRDYVKNGSFLFSVGSTILKAGKWTLGVI